MFALGVQGWVAAPGNVIPGQCVKLYELAAVKKDLEAARELYFRMLPFFQALESGQFVQYVKAGLEIIGRPIGPPRKPLLLPAREDYERLRQVLAGLAE
jgi:4-hydroxy-tetrahydrodipicolinate synthase